MIPHNPNAIVIHFTEKFVTWVRNGPNGFWVSQAKRVGPPFCKQMGRGKRRGEGRGKGRRRGGEGEGLGFYIIDNPLGKRGPLRS